MVSIPLLAIISSLGLCILVKRYGQKARWLGAVTLMVIVGLGVYNANYFDIGRRLDQNMSASNFYYNEFTKIPDKTIFMPNYAWEWEAIYKYNADYGKHIYPICIDILPSKLYQEQLTKTDWIKLTTIVIPMEHSRRKWKKHRVVKR